MFTHQRRGSVDVGRQLALTILALFGVIVIGTLGYRVLGIGWLGSLYATVYTVTTVGFHDVEPSGPPEKIFTILLMLFGIGLVLYTLTLLTASLIEGHIGSLMGRRRMQREIDALSRHTIVCGYGRVGKATAHELHRAGRDVVVVDVDEDRLADCPYPSVLGNASSDHVLRQAGIDRASTLVATLDTDADSLYVTLSARAINADLMIIARSRTDDADKKFTRAGADRVVNPQRLGGDRIAAFARQPHVVDFLDVALQRDEDSDKEFRLEDVTVRERSSLVGLTVSEVAARDSDGALLLALRTPTGSFVTNPPADQVIGEGDVLIVVGSVAQVDTLRSAARA